MQILADLQNLTIIFYIRGHSAVVLFFLMFVNLCDAETWSDCSIKLLRKMNCFFNFILFLILSCIFSIIFFWFSIICFIFFNYVFFFAKFAIDFVLDERTLRKLILIQYFVLIYYLVFVLNLVAVLEIFFWIYLRGMCCCVLLLKCQLELHEKSLRTH